MRAGHAEAAGLHHPEVAEREVVADGIGGIEAAQRRGDLGRHLPARRRLPRQAEAPAQPDDVRVERHHQLRRRHARPAAGIDGVAPHHPAQEQVQPLARAAAGRPREEVAVAGTRRDGAAVGRAHVDGAGARRRRRRAPARRRPRAGSWPATKAPSIDPCSRSIACSTSISATRSAPRIQRCTTGVSARASRRGIEVADVARRVRAHHVDDAPDRRHHAGDAPERQPRGDERRRSRDRPDPRWSGARTGRDRSPNPRR